MSRPDLHGPFLEGAGWSGSEIRPLADDASFRSYHRVSGPKGDAVLMDAPPPQEDVRPFMAISGYLTNRGLTAPRVIAADKKQGFLLLDDLGDDTFNRVFSRTLAPEQDMYEAAIDVLLELHKEPAPSTIAIDANADANETFSVEQYDAEHLLAAAHLFTEWYLPLIEGREGRAAGVGEETTTAEFAALYAPGLKSVTDGPEALVLRDYHADNLMWLSANEGLKRVGLLDFQDAVKGHPAYDLVSLLRDARRDVSLELEEDMIQRYIEGNRGAIGSPEDFRTAYAALGAQRNAMIIGVFSRLCIRDGKPGYLAMIPRVWGLLERSLEHPALADLKAWYDARVPAAARRVAPEPPSGYPPPDTPPGYSSEHPKGAAS